MSGTLPKDTQTYSLSPPSSPMLMVVYQLKLKYAAKPFPSLHNRLLA